MDIYQNWGFRNNPFNTVSLSGDLIGNELIAGREQEINKFLRRLYNQPQIVTVEGENGMGKSSLINVAIFRALEKHLSDKSSPLYLPCGRSFQISAESNYEKFIFDVLVEIAQTFIKYKDDLKKLNVKLPDLGDLDKWLNSSHNNSYEISIGIPFAQFGGGKTSETNTSGGFEQSGIALIISNCLRQIFPNKNSGGIVCVIDNMELLERSSNARKVIENLRDTLFNIHGIRWVFCGSQGIVTSILSSPRLEGYLHDPIYLEKLLGMYVKDVLQKRVDTFGKKKSYLPITEGSFAFLYEILRGNLRNTLKYTNEYCMSISDDEVTPQTIEEKESCFMNWLSEKSNKFKMNVERHLKQKSIQLLKDSIELGGCFAYGDFELLGFESVQAIKSHVKELEITGLVVNVIDENDHRRRSIQVTDKGLFASYAMFTL